jgi:guanylate kinase
LKYKPLIVVGPSGVGKGTLINAVLANYGGLFERKVSYTTRSKKGYEKSEGNYNFTTKEDFMRVRIL